MRSACFLQVFLWSLGAFRSGTSPRLEFAVCARAALLRRSGKGHLLALPCVPLVRNMAPNARLVPRLESVLCSDPCETHEAQGASKVKSTPGPVSHSSLLISIQVGGPAHCHVPCSGYFHIPVRKTSQIGLNELCASNPASYDTLKKYNLLPSKSDSC